MRKTTAATAILVLVLATAGAALAAFSQYAKVSFTAKKAGQSTGLVSDLHSSDPTAPGGKPKAARNVVMTFPSGTKFNLGTSLVTRCTLSDKQLANQFGPSCPKKSLIGTGKAVANASPLVAKVDANVTAYVRSAKQMVLVVKPTNPALASQINVIHADVSGSKLTIPIPPIKAAGISVVLTSLKLTVPKVGSGGRALITAGRCVRKQFVVTVNLTYADHSKYVAKSTSPCS